MSSPDAATPFPPPPAPNPAETVTFANTPLAAGELPQLDGAAFESIDPAYVRLRSLTAIAVTLGIAVLTVVVAAMADSWIPTAIGVGITLLAALIGSVLRADAKRMGYLVREHDLSYRHGVIGREMATVPFARVQHVSIRRGPIDRHFGLATLQVRTAGGALAIPGLPDEAAERLKSYVGDRATQLAEAETDGDGR